jgi:starch phosphorylase
MAMLSPLFNTNRMVAQYTDRFYFPSARRHAELSADGARRARALVAWRHRVRDAWPHVKVQRLRSNISDRLTMGASVEVMADVRLGALSTEDVRVELYYGPLDAAGAVRAPQTGLMNVRESRGDLHVYAGHLDCHDSGLCGFTVRVLPWHPDAVLPYEVPLIAWADGTLDRTRAEETVAVR